MTSDAKMGLLLGLVFIFIIAFILNGLPKFGKDGNNNELTTNTFDSQNNSPGIGTRQRRVSREVISRTSPVREVYVTQSSNQDVRFEAPLPELSLEPKETVEVKEVAISQLLVDTEKEKITPVEANRTTLPKTYVVSEGDSLAVIARKFYGPEDGNKRVNIARIFEANRKQLESPDEIYEGQELVIPSLLASAGSQGRTSSILASSMFEKVKSIGGGYLQANNGGAEATKWYVVREGDSLWQIADEMLGDGNRYSEIVELNATALPDEDNLVIGTRLKIPVK